MSTEQSSSGGGGCLTLIVTIVILWALFCGVTYKGHHYEMKCSCEKGVGIE